MKNIFKKLKLQIIDRYIMRRFLGTYFFAIALIIVIVVIFDAAEKIDDFMEGHAPMYAIVFEYYVNFIPFFVNQFSGLFTFIAVIFFTSKMAYDTEIIAILSSGVSFRRLMYPYFISAITITIFSLTLNLFMIPHANAKRMAFEAKYMGKGKSIYEEHIYRQLEPGTFIYIRGFDDKKKTARYMAIETYGQGGVVSSLEAQTVRFDTVTSHWTAPKYIMRHYENDREVLTKYETKLDTAVNLIADELGRTDDLVQTMNSIQLDRFIDQQKAKGSDMVAIFQVEAYSRWAYPISTFILTLIGVSLSSRKVRGGTGLHIGVGIALCFSYIVLMRFTGEFAKGGVLHPGIAVWIPNIVYAIIGVYLYQKAPK